MNQIDKILPSKEEVDELLGEDKPRVYIVDGTTMGLTDIELAALSAVCLKASDAALMFKNSSDRSEVNIFMKEEPKKKNKFFNLPSVPSNKRRFGK